MVSYKITYFQKSLACIHCFGLFTKINKPLGTNGPQTKNDSDNTQDIRIPYVGNGYV